MEHYRLLNKVNYTAQALITNPSRRALAYKI